MADHDLTPPQLDFLTRFIGAGIATPQPGAAEIGTNPVFDEDATAPSPLYEGGKDDDDSGNKDEGKSAPKGDKKGAESSAAKKESAPASDPKPAPDPKEEALSKPAAKAEPKRAKPELDEKRLSKAQAKTLGDLKKLDKGVHDSLVATLAVLDQGQGLSLDRAKHPKTAKAALTTLKEREAAQAEVNAAANKLTTAKAALETLQRMNGKSDKIAEAKSAVEQALRDKDTAEQALKDKKAAHDAAQARLQGIADQRMLIEQIDRRMKSRDAPLDAEDAKRLIDCFATNPAAVKTALQQIDKVPREHRKSFVAHVETAVTALDTLVQGPEKAQMAANAVLMGARGGPEYTAGFAKYYAGERPKGADPSGGMDDPKTDAKEESARIAKVSKKRAALLAQAVLSDSKDKGVAIDLESEAAQDALADLQFHPGALKTLTPALNAEALAMKKVCAENKGEIEKRLGTCSAPKTEGATSLVRNALSMGDTEAVGEKQAQVAVLSAMFTPIAQGAVGSCASTAPLVAAKANAPLAVMDRLIEIASNGTFTPIGGDAIPANTAFAPDAGNDLSRSLEFSVATASANLDNSIEMKKLRQVVTGQKSRLLGGWFALGQEGQGLLSVSGVEWAKSESKQTPQAAISRAISTHLRVAYDAVSDISTSDGRSTKGGHKLHFTPEPDTEPHKFEIIESEDQFKDAMASIALKAAGLKADSKEGKKLVSTVKSTKFSTKVTDQKEPFKPWDIGRAPGFFPQTTKVLSGEDIVVQNLLGASKDKKTSGQRVEAVLSDVMKTFGSSKDALTPMSTQGDRAQHGFNFLKDGPGQELVSGANSVESFAKASRDAVTETKLSADKADETFIALAQRALALWSNLDADALERFMSKAPGKEMTQQELHAYAKAELAPVVAAMVKKRAANRAAKPGEKKSAKEIEKDEAKILAGAFDSEIDAVMLAENPPDFVTIADTNWGGPQSRDFFVVAADPSTGDLRLWVRSDPDGRMRPADSYALAAWQQRKPAENK